jgi:hypothetical protein
VEESRSGAKNYLESSDLAARSLKTKRAEDFLRYRGWGTSTATIYYIYRLGVAMTTFQNVPMISQCRERSERWKER